jgi:hypothetical protein
MARAAIFRVGIALLQVAAVGDSPELLMKLTKRRTWPKVVLPYWTPPFPGLDQERAATDIQI